MTPTTPVEAGPQSTAATTSKSTPTRTVSVDGTPFAYRELGPRTGVPLVFLPHFTAVLDDWDPRVIDGIAAKRHVIAFDNRGIGASGGPVPETIDEMAADAVAFIRVLGYDQVDLLGFSLGGGVAQVITLEHPELVRRVILAGTGPVVAAASRSSTGSRPARTPRPRSRCAIHGTSCSSTGIQPASAPRVTTRPD
jgi:pimeloyl-ACP methyl ester carboxylesterase